MPGGQNIYIAPSGYLGYTAAHSTFYPDGAVIGVFTDFFQPGYENYGYVSTNAFGAEGFMACPTIGGTWQVFAAIANATVPSGNISSCIGFDAITSSYSGDSPAAWQYT